MPRFIRIRAEAEVFGVFDEPEVGTGADLDRAVGVLRLHGIAADVKIEGAAGEVGGC